jgi:hypothetical protein
LQDKADAAGLPRTVRALAVASAVTVLFFFGSWSQSFIGFFVAATYWRTLLVPKEVRVFQMCPWCPVYRHVLCAGFVAATYWHSCWCLL